MAVLSRPTSAQTPAITINTIPSTSDEVLRLLVTAGQGGANAVWWQDEPGQTDVGSISADSDILILPDPTPGESTIDVALDLARLQWLGNDNKIRLVRGTGVSGPTDESFARWVSGDDTLTSLNSSYSFADDTPGSTMSIYIAIEGHTVELPIDTWNHDVFNNRFHFTVPTTTNAALDGVEAADKINLVIGQSSAVPSAPAEPVVTAATASLDVSWVAPTANGSAITDYDVQFRAGTSGPFTPFTAKTGTSTTIPNLTVGTSYEVQVRAVNAIGNGPWSASGTGTPSAAAPDAAAYRVGRVDLRASAEGKVVERWPVVGSLVYIHGDLTPDITSCTGTLRQWQEGHEGPFNDPATIAASSHTMPGDPFALSQVRPKAVVYAMQAPDGSTDEASCTTSIGGNTENRQVDRVRVEWIEDSSDRPIIDWLETVSDWPGGKFGATLAFPALLALGLVALTGSVPLAGISFVAAFAFFSVAVGLSTLALAIVVVVALGFGLSYTLVARNT